MKSPSKIQKGILIATLIPTILLHIDFWWIPFALHKNLSTRNDSRTEESSP